MAEANKNGKGNEVLEELFKYCYEMGKNVSLENTLDEIGNKYGIPAFVACGESEIPYDSLKYNLKFKDLIKGVICVSTKCKEESIHYGLCNQEKTVVIPNAIDNNHFFKRDKDKCRNELGFPNDAFIISFVGFL